MVFYFPVNNSKGFMRIPKSKSSIQCLVGTIIPQAAESAQQTFGLTGLFLSAVLYTVYALVIDCAEASAPSLVTVTYNDKDKISPQSEETQQMEGTPETSSQNVKFVDTHPGYTADATGDVDALRDAALAGDATLDEFFSRPIRIASQEWAVGSTLFFKFNPWSLYFENPRVINRISNYKLLRSKLHIKIMINGNAFHYGRAIASYNPLPSDDKLTRDREFFSVDVVGASQRPHIYLDPTNSQGGDLILPFFTYLNVLDITQQDWQNMGTMVVQSLQDLKHANGAVDTVSVNVFAWAEEIKFAIPTSVEPGAIVPQSDEYERKPVSMIAGAVAKAAGAWKNAPIIGPYARATEIGAGAMGAIATLFGYSRPVMLESCVYRPMTKPNIAVTNVPDDVVKLSVDAKQELTIDSRTVGLSGIDELAISNIVTRESYVTQFDWAVGTVAENLLFNLRVDPGIHNRLGSEIHLPATAYAVLPFKYWRGTLKYRFQVVCSKYHKGRLKIVYDPTSCAGTTAEYNTAYTTIVDISDTTDFTVDIGWGQHTSWREALPPTTGTAEMFSTLALGPTFNTANGNLAVYVVNELTVPNTEINNDISINVFISAGDDFEVAEPNNDFLAKMRFQEATPVRGDTEVIASDDFKSLTPQSEETMKMDSQPSKPPSVNQMGMSTSTSDSTTLVHFGESISSFRQLMKRYNLHEFIPQTSLSTTPEKQLATFQRGALPYDPGYTNDPGNLTLSLTGGDYAYANMTMLRYATCAFGGWRGGVRYYIDTSTGSDSYNPNIMTVTRENEDEAGLGNFYTTLTDQLTASGKAALLTGYARAIGHEGCHTQSNRVNPTVSFEVPYYSRFRFSPAKQRSDFDGTGFSNEPHWQMIVQGAVHTPDDTYQVYVAAAEDFNCFMFLGAPVLFYENSPPDL